MTGHAARVEHRSSGWKRWRGTCDTCPRRSAWGNERPAAAWVESHMREPLR